DAMTPSAADPAFFTGSLWLMASGAWQVHFDIDGDAGKANISVPVSALPLSILPMERPLSIGLALLGILLVAGIAGIVAAAVGQSRRNSWLDPGPTARRGAWVAGLATLAISMVLVYGGYKWWNLEATSYAADIFRPLNLRPELSGNRLDLRIGRQDTDAQHA